LKDLGREGGKRKGKLGGSLSNFFPCFRAIRPVMGRKVWGKGRGKEGSLFHSPFFINIWVWGEKEGRRRKRKGVPGSIGHLRWWSSAKEGKKGGKEKMGVDFRIILRSGGGKRIHGGEKR